MEAEKGPFIDDRSALRGPFSGSIPVGRSVATGSWSSPSAANV